MPTTFNNRQFQDDMRAYIASYHGPKKDRNGEDIPTMTPKEFTDKYPQFFSSNTDLSRLPKTPEGMAALVASSAIGAQKSVIRDRIASKGIEAFIDNDEELKDIFDVKNYSDVVENEDGEKETVYLQKAEQITKMIKDIAMVQIKYIDSVVNERLEMLREDMSTEMNTQNSIMENSLKDYTRELVTTKVPRLMEAQTNENNVKSIFNHYSGQVIANNGEDNQVAKLLKNAGSNEEITKIYDDWGKATLTKFNNWNKNKTSGAKYSPELIKSFADNALSEVLSMRGEFLTEELPKIDMNANVSFSKKPEQTNQQAPQAQVNSFVPGGLPPNAPDSITGTGVPKSVGNVNQGGDSQTAFKNKLSNALGGLITNGQQQ